MKTNNLKSLAAVMAITGLIFTGASVLAQVAPAATTVQPAAVNAPAPQLAYGVPQVLQLVQAEISDATIIAYIKSSGNSYGLTADQIIYLRQQGVSDVVVNAMLNQPRAGVMAAPTTPAPQSVASTSYTEPASTATVAPTVTYVQTAPQAVYYADPYYSQPYYYPAYGYGYYPPVALSFGWGWGGGWHGGGYGGGWHGGGYGGGHGGGHH